MKREMFRKLMAASLATVMTVGLAACGNNDTPASASDSSSANESSSAVEDSSVAESSSEEEVSPYPVLKDENGNVYDLGGMEVVIRDWWSGEPEEPKNQYDEDTLAYREWIQETYNFTITQTAISDWGSAPADFVEYASMADDGNNYIFILRSDAATTSAMSNGLMYDLASLDCLDFTEEKFTLNKVHELYSKGGKIYAMINGASEPRTGLYFNKRLLQDIAKVDPESLYDMQKDGTWTWDKFIEILETIKKNGDTDNDGTPNVYGITQNASVLTQMAVFSNNGEFIGMEDGKYVYSLEDPETLEGLEWAVDIFDNYTLVYPEGANWDYYKQAYNNGEAVFLTEDAYYAGADLTALEDEFGFVMFPKGPQMEQYTNCWANNLAAIPANYDAEKAWKIAFAWNLYTEETPGWEGSDSWKTSYYNNFSDTRAVDETLAMMREPEYGMITYHNMIPSLDFGNDFCYGITAGTDVSAAVAAIRDTWKGYLDVANQ